MQSITDVHDVAIRLQALMNSSSRTEEGQPLVMVVLMARS